MSEDIAAPLFIVWLVPQGFPPPTTLEQMESLRQASSTYADMVSIMPNGCLIVSYGEDVTVYAPHAWSRYEFNPAATPEDFDRAETMWRSAGYARVDARDL